MQKQSRLSKFSSFEFSRLKGGGQWKAYRCVQGGEGGSEIGDFTAYVLYGCPLTKVTNK